MAKIDQLIPKLRAEAQKELEMFMGKAERQFFIETFQADSVDALLKEYTPDEHNSKWDEERQKPAPDPERIIQERQAIAFMNSGKLGLYRRYAETELTAHVVGNSRMIRNRYFLSLTDSLTKMKMYDKG